MATCYLRGILSTQSENILKMQGLEPSIGVEFRNGFFQKGVQLKTFFFCNFLALIDGVTATCKNAVNRACGYLGGPLGFSKLFLGASAGTPRPLWKGKLAAESLGNAFAVRKTDRLHFYKSK